MQADEDIKDDLLDDASQSEGEGEKSSGAEDAKDSQGDASNPNSPKIKKRKPRRAD